jgi:YidC/Oxa1 family membrane protein insertase
VKNKIENTRRSYTAGLQSELYAVQSFEKNPDAFLNAGKIGSETLQRFTKLKENMNFFGIDLGETPGTTLKFGFNRVMIVPIISVLFSLAQMLFMQYVQKKTMPETYAQSGASMKIMLIIQPVMSFIISLQVPAGVGFYWATSYLFGILQSMVIYKFYPPEKMRAEAQEKLKTQIAKYNTTAIIRDAEDSEKFTEKRVSDMSGKEQKEFYKKRLEEARKADALRYGEEDEVDLESVIAERLKSEKSE